MYVPIRNDDVILVIFLMLKIRLLFVNHSQFEIYFSGWAEFDLKILIIITV